MKPRLLFTILRHRSLPWAVSLVVTMGMSVSIYNQWQQLSELLHEEPARKQTVLEPTKAPTKYRENLFGEPRPQTQPIPERSPLPMTLVGSFVHPVSERSSAMIVVSGGPPRLFKSGDQIVPGAILNEVQPSHVVLSRNGSLDPLYFPDVMKVPAKPVGQVVRYADLSDSYLKKLHPTSSESATGLRRESLGRVNPNPL
ncbi:MAG: type II secretion system protein N [Pseudomonadales bacterium]